MSTHDADLKRAAELLRRSGLLADLEFTIGECNEMIALADRLLAMGTAGHANFLRECSSEWAAEKNDAAVTVHHRMVEGVLCRWWGDGETPKGVAIIDRAMGTAPVDEKLIADMERELRSPTNPENRELLYRRCRTALASTAPAEQRDAREVDIQRAAEILSGFGDEKEWLAIADRLSGRVPLTASPQDTQQEKS